MITAAARLCALVLAGTLVACSSPEKANDAASPAAAATPAPAAAPPAPAISGPLHGAPTPSADVLNKINDLSRDISALGARAPGSVADFTSDLGSLVADPPPDATLKPFGDGVAAAVEGHALETPKAKRLAELLYIALNTVELNDQQRAALKGELSALLREAGAPADRVAAVESTLARL